MILIKNNAFKPVVSSHAQYSGFNQAYLVFGDPGGAYSTFLAMNRVISNATDTESSRADFGTSRAPQGASGFSPCNIYHMKGYNAGLITTVNKTSATTDTSSTPTISFTVERRGPCYPLANYNRNRIYYLGGYSDTLGAYQQVSTYVTQNTETPTETTSLSATRHLGAVLSTRDNLYIEGGYTTGGVTTNTIYKYIMTTDTISLNSNYTSVAQGSTLCYSSFGYRANGTVGYNANTKFTFSTETPSAGVSGPEAVTINVGIGSVSVSTGYCVGGYRSSILNRVYHKLTFATETWSNNSYTTADTNSGFINAPGGC